MDFNFSISTQIQFGAGKSRQAGLITRNLISAGKTYSSEEVFVIIDPGIQQTGWLKEILDGLVENDLHFQLFEQVKPNPREEDVHAAAVLVRELNIKALIAIGGGSTLDTAKGAALLGTYGGKASDYAGWAKLPGAVLPVVAIPTTAGSGSEATCWAVISDDDSHTKLAIGDPNLAPVIALVDPLVTISLPAAITAATGMDALTHSIEAYLCTLASPINDLLALESIRLVAANLNNAVSAGEDLTAREGMLLASLLGGIAINNADVAGVHCLSESMGGRYDAPHGLLNAILLPYFMSFWKIGCSERFIHIAETFGAEPIPEEAVSRVSQFTRSLNFPSLKQIGVKSADLPVLAALAEANVSNPSNPVPMKASDYQLILEKAMMI